MARRDLYEQVIQQIQAGDPMAAYSVFEQLPFTDQMGLYLTPGVGDAIAAVEAGVYNERAKQNFMEGNIGSGLLDTVIGGTAAASTIPFAGKVAEGLNLGAKGLNRGISTLRSKMGDGMSGGGGGIDQTFKLKLAEKENIENMGVEELNSFIAKNDERLMDFTDEIARGNKLDPSSEALMKALENRNRIALNAKATKLYDPDFNPSGFDPDFPADRQGIAKQAEFVDDPMKPGSTADLERQRMSRLTESEQTNIPKVREMIQKEKNLVAASNKEQIANRIQRELELEGGDMAPATRKRLESKLRTLRKEIAELRGS